MLRFEDVKPQIKKKYLTRKFRHQKKQTLGFS